MKTQVLIATTLSFAAVAACAATLDTNRIEQLTGLKGLWNAAEGRLQSHATAQPTCR
jgi:hypothetical protein